MNTGIDIVFQQPGNTAPRVGRLIDVATIGDAMVYRVEVAGTQIVVPVEYVQRATNTEQEPSR